MASLNRREFVGSLLVGSGAVLAGGAQAAVGPLRSPTAQVTLGKTGIRTTLLGLGTGMRGSMGQSNHTRMGLEAFTRLVRHAWDRGIRLFDSAELYGTHPFLRTALQGLPRADYQIQSKIWFGRRGMPQPTTDALSAIQRFVGELGVDYVDSVLLHCTTAGAWTDDLKSLMDGLDEAKAKGLIRSHGTSCHSWQALQASLASPWVDVQLARINHKGTAMDGEPAVVAGLLKSMRAAGKGVIGMKIIGEGRFQTPEEREASLRFVLGQGCVDAMIIGFEQPAQIDETVAMMTRVMSE